jgi:glycosyltransferase 2 family protein
VPTPQLHHRSIYPKQTYPVKKILLNFLRFCVFLGIGVLILVLLYRHQNAAYQEECAQSVPPVADCNLLDKVFGDFATVNYGWMLAVILSFTASNIVRSIRWLMLLRPLGYEPRLLNAFFCTMIGYFANLGLPRLGEFLRAVFMARFEKMPFEKVIGTVVVDRAMDVISILIITAVGLVLEFDTIWAFAQANIPIEQLQARLIKLALVGIPLLFFALFMLWYFRKALAATKIGQKVLGIADGFWQGIQTVRQLERPWLFVLYSVLIWVFFLMMTRLSFYAFAPTKELPSIVALMVFIFGTWGIIVPSPGGMGSYHFLVKTALSMYKVSGANGFSYANIFFFAVQLGGNILQGLSSWILLPLMNRNYTPSKLPADEPAPAS